MVADRERTSNPDLEEGSTLQDDYDPDSHKHEKLRDCAGVLTKAFMVCQSDRRVHFIVH